MLLADIGSSYLALCRRVDDGGLATVFYGPHQGRVAGLLEQFCEGAPFLCAGPATITSGGVHLTAALTALADNHARCRHVLYVGAGSYCLVNIAPDGRYRSHRVNSSCASGTGSFLDAQARRLGLAPDELGRRALGATAHPAVSTRCSVFAKTDLIHLQQEGYTKDEIAAGLCRGLARTITETLFQGRKPEGPVVLAGGVFQNDAIRIAVSDLLGADTVCDSPHLAVCRGLAALAMTGRAGSGMTARSLSTGNEAGQERLAPLAVEHPGYPDFSSFDITVDAGGTERTRFAASSAPGMPVDVWIGIDIGSTSTKLCVIDDNAQPLLALYRKTASDPVTAVKRLLASLQQDGSGEVWRVRGVATTGSGRQLIARLIGADGIINEITAHAKAAHLLDPSVDTIIEIGGQDAKYTRLRSGTVSFSAMNYVCAAGTGSFIEEQAEKLGMPIERFSEIAKGRSPAPVSDRCTVFMERDIDLMLARGVPPEEIAASVMVSVRDNYLNKVKGTTPIGSRVCFQGATARNPALVSAFEQRLGLPIAVSPCCHVTGALGAALHARELAPESSSFRGLGFAAEVTTIEKESCDLCSNACTLTVARSGDTTTGWGMKCGKSFDETAPRRIDPNPFLDHRRRTLAPVSDSQVSMRLGMPDMLANAERALFLTTLLRELGIEPVVTAPSVRDYAEGRTRASHELCAPCICAFGAVANAMPAGLPLFMPHFLRKEVPEGISACHFCPITQAAPSLLRSLLPDRTIVAPRIFETFPDAVQADGLVRSLSPFVIISRRDAMRALRAARDAERQDAETRWLAGERFLAGRDTDRPGIVVLGRPYLIHNRHLNHGIFEVLAAEGADAIPVDFLRPDDAFVREHFPHMYWDYGRIILSALSTVRRHRTMFPLFVSSFSCGPDSFILGCFTRVMDALGKPYLVLQFDGHSADNGYRTRIEAALDSFKAYIASGASAEHRKLPRFPRPEAVRHDGRVLFPPLDHDGAALLAAATRGSGIDADVLQETPDAFRTGVSLSTGHECAPFHSTLGALAARLSSEPGRATSVFMPTGTGPCRFGQYAVMQRAILDEKGLPVTFLSPAAENAYGGLPRHLIITLFDAMIVNDILKKALLSIRPYERVAGSADKVYAAAMTDVTTAFEGGGDVHRAVHEALAALAAVPAVTAARPRIGIVGEIYVRNNRFLNDDLIRTIEAGGGEALPSSVSEWFLYTLHLGATEPRSMRRRLAGRLKYAWFIRREHRWYGIARGYLPLAEPAVEEILDTADRYIPRELLGEAALTVGRARLFALREGADAVVNAIPAFCMPGSISAFLLSSIERETGIPFVTLSYDRSGRPNDELLARITLLSSRRRS